MQSAFLTEVVVLWECLSLHTNTSTLVRTRCVRSTCKQSQVKAKSAVHKMHFLTGWKTYSEHRYNIILLNIKVSAYHSQHMATFSCNYTIKRNKDKLLILL